MDNRPRSVVAIRGRGKSIRHKGSRWSAINLVENFQSLICEEFVAKFRLMRIWCSLFLACALSAQTARSPASISARTSQPNASVQTMVAYPLTDTGLDRYAAASRNMTALIQKDPAVLNKLKPVPGNAPNSVEDTVTFSKKHCPECVAAVEKSGMPYRDYVVFQGGLLIAYVSVRSPRNAARVHVSPDNIKFVLANKPKIEKILAEQRTQPAKPKQ